MNSDTENKTEAVSAEYIKVYNDYKQSLKPDEDQRQYSYEKLGIENWEMRDMTGREILALQSFVETSGVVSPAYAFWKLCGNNVTLNDVVGQVIEHEDEIPEEAKPWVNNILSGNYNPTEMEEKIKEGEISPPLLFYPILGQKELKSMGLLNMGNILDGNHRMMDVARWLKDQSPEDIDNFKMRVFVGRVDPFKYLLFNAYYLAEPWINNARNRVRESRGSEVDKMDKGDVMNFHDRWCLLLQRIGYHKYNNDREN